MVKFTSFALLALAAVGVYAQESSPSPSASESSASSAQPTTPPASSSSASSGGEGGASGVCTILVGDPKVKQYDCPYSSTSTPPYDLNSLMGYLIGGYEPGKEGVATEDVANELAGSVLKYYPTLTESREVIASSFGAALSASIDAARASDSSVRDIPQSAVSFAVAAVAVVAAGAFAL